MKVISIFLFSLILLFSCEKSSFDYSIARLRLNKADEAETLEFSTLIDGEDESYNITVKDPSGKLSWTGSLEERDGRYSILLEITDGASFVPGEYAFSIFGSGGTEVSGAVNFRRNDPDIYEENGILSGNFEGEAEMDESPVEIGESVESGDTVTVRDAFFNTYTITL